MNTLREIIADHIKYRKQIFSLAKSDIVKTYRNTALGWSWAIIRPSIMIGIYYFAFSVGLRVGVSVEGYPYFLWIISGIIPWFYVRDVFVNGAYSIRKYRYLVTKVKFPVSTIPTFVNLSDFIINMALTIVVMILFIAFGKYPDVYWLQLPLYTAMMFVFFISWSLFASVLATISSDFLQLVKAMVTALFWLSGVMYNVGNITSPVFRKVLLLNPITVIINGYRNSFIYKEWFWENLGELRNFAVAYIIITILAIWAYKKLIKDIPDVL